MKVHDDYTRMDHTKQQCRQLHATRAACPPPPPLPPARELRSAGASLYRKPRTLPAVTPAQDP